MKFDTAVPLAQGATGEVLKAWDNDSGRWVAIKILRHADAGWMVRMEREAAALKRLCHDHICPLLGTGTHRGLPCLYLQFIDGAPIDQALADADLNTRLKVLVDICAAIQYAHTADVLHRDLKPGNILVETRDDGQFHPYVVDFGLARSVSDATLTIDGQLLGTPGYMSPEQAAGRPATRQSDIYSLGVVAFELLSGCLPHRAESVAELLLQVVNFDAPSIRSVDPRLPETLNLVLHKCLERQPQLRYRSARDLHDELQACIRGRPVQAPRVGIAHRLKRRLIGSPRLAAAGLAGALGVLAAGAYGGYQQWRVQAVSEQVAALEQQISQAELNLRLIYTKPLHDVRAEVSEVVRPFQEPMNTSEPLLVRARLKAQGRLGFALGDHARVIESLSQALAAGAKDDLSKELLAHAHTDQYFQKLAVANRLRDVQRQSDAVQAAREAHLEPALALLRQLTHSTLSTTAALRARLEGNREEAVATLAVKPADEIWPLPRWHLAQKLIAEQALEQLRRGEIAGARRHLAEAGVLAIRATQYARSDPTSYRLRCSLLSLLASSAIVGDSVRTPDPASCDDLLTIDRDELENRLTAAAGFERLARLAHNQAQDPGPWLKRALEVLGDPEKASKAQALHRIGSLKFTAATWIGRTGEPSVSALEQAGVVLEKAYAANSSDPDLARELAALYAQMASAFYNERGADGDPLFAKSAALLRTTAQRWPDQASTLSRLAMTLSDQAYFRYARGVEAQALLAEAVTAAEQAARLRPDDVPTLAALARAAFTQMDYQILRGESPDVAGQIMERSYGRVISANPQRFASRFNQASGMANLADAWLSAGKSADALLGRLNARLDELYAMSDESQDLSYLQGMQHALAALAQIESGLPHESELSLAYQYLNQSTSLPLDGFLAWEKLAGLKLSVHRFAAQAEGFDVALFEVDLARLQEALEVHPKQHTLRALVSQLAQLGSAQSEINNVRQAQLAALAQQLLSQALEANPLLKTRFQQG
ncbi:MAG: protein kinase [Lysobacterales bacterium]